ncbi:MAG: glycosyl hydrolase-related protein, partial [Eubacteriales bacterium]|nr:glycosyl hydrolase-related protein [Eubacteriales bacterium]
HGRRTECQLTFGRALRSVSECDLKENQLESLPFEVDQLTMTFRPYDIRTLKVRLAAELTAHA